MTIDSSKWEDQNRKGGLRRFAIAITVLNILGHAWFGFEQSYAQPLAALAAAYATELGLELVDARLQRRRPRFAGGGMRFIDFLLSAHITALACAMLLYANSRMLPVVFAAVAAIGSKALFRAGSRHFFNPSNFGITCTLLLFPWVGIAPPYHFTENLDGVADWLLPGIVVITGSFLNGRFTRRLPLIASWVTGFALQAAIRSLVFGTPLTAALLPMTGVAFILYTFYMVTDPATTPSGARAQAAFGLSVAAAYGTLVTFHVPFGLFFGLTLVCAGRGALLYARQLTAARSYAKQPAEATEPALIGAK